MAEKHQPSKGRVLSIKEPVDVTDDDASDDDEMDADLIWSSSPGHTSDEDGIRPRIVESERFSITSDDISSKPHQWGETSFADNNDEDEQQTIAYEPQRPLTVPGQILSNRNVGGMKGILNNPINTNNSNAIQQGNEMSERQLNSYTSIVEERPQTTVGIQVGITSWDWLARLEQLLIHFFLIIFDSSSDFSKTLMEVFPVEASAQIEEIFRLLLQADPEMYENLGYLVGMAEKWLVQWNSKSSTKKEALEFIRLYMIGCKHRNYYSVPIYARLQKLGSFISGLRNLSGTAGAIQDLVFTAQQIKDYNLETDPPPIEKAAWEKRLPSPRVKPASHFARVVANILCDRPCERPLTSPDIYADPVTKTYIPTNLATETELTTLTDMKYGRNFVKKDLFFYPALTISRERPMKVDPCNKKCWIPVYTDSYLELVQDEMEECSDGKGGKESAAMAALRERLRRKKIEKYEVEYEYEYEYEPEYEYEYEYELDENGKIKLGQDGLAILKRDAQGNPIVKRDSNGQPIVRKGSNGQPRVKRDSKGRIIYKTDEKGRPVPKVDSEGNPIVKLGRDGKPILKLDKFGKSIIKLVDGKPVYKKGADGKRIHRENASEDSLLDDKSRKHKMRTKEFKEMQAKKEKAKAREEKELLKKEVELAKKQKKKEKKERDRSKAKEERELRKGTKGKKKGKRGSRKNRGSDLSGGEFSDEDLSDEDNGKKRRQRKSTRKSETGSLGARSGAGKSKTSRDIAPDELQRKSQDPAVGKDAVRVGFVLTGESGAVLVKRSNRKAQELAKARAKVSEKGEQKAERLKYEDDKRKLLKNSHPQGDIDFDVDFEETVETFPMLSVRQRRKSARLESYPDGDTGRLAPIKNRFEDTIQQRQDALSKSRLRGTDAVSGKRRTEIQKPSGKEFKKFNVLGKVDRTIYRPTSRMKKPRKIEGLFVNESNKDRMSRLAQPRAAISLLKFQRPLNLKRAFRYPEGKSHYDTKFKRCGRKVIDCGKSGYALRNAHSEGMLSGGTVEEEEECAHYYFPPKLDHRSHKITLRERIQKSFPNDIELPNLNTCWDLDSDLFKKPMKGVAIPPAENILAHIEKIFPRLKWPKGSPLAVRYYPNGRIFCATFKNGSGEVFYPHGGLAIAISNPNPVNRVLIIRDPYDKFYFMDKAILADLDCSGKGCVYNSDGATSLQYNSVGGFRLQGIDKTSSQRWTWIRGGQRIILKLNRYMSLRILDFNRIHLVFNGNKRGVRFNVGPGRIINLMSVEPDEKFLAIEAGKHGDSCYDDHFDYYRGKFTTPTLGFFDNSRFCPEILPEPSQSCPLDCNNPYFRCTVSDPCLCDCVN